MENLKIKIEDKQNVRIMKTEGFIDTLTSSILEAAMEEALKAKKYRIILDLAGTDYISSAGWGIFVGYKKNLMKNKGDIKLANMKPEVLEVYEVLDFTHILEYFGDVEKAVRAF